MSLSIHRQRSDPDLVSAEPATFRAAEKTAAWREEACGREGAAEASGARRAPLHTLKSHWLVVLSTVALLSVFSLCFRFRQAAVSRHPGGRRLAGRGSGQHPHYFPGPPSPDFVDLCNAVGNWQPDDTQPGNPRASPELVGEVLRGLEFSPGLESSVGCLHPSRQPQENYSSSSPWDADFEFPTSGASLAAPTSWQAKAGDGPRLSKLLLKRLASHDGNDDFAGPSWKAARIDNSPLPSQQPHSYAAQQFHFLQEGYPSDSSAFLNPPSSETPPAAHLETGLWLSPQTQPAAVQSNSYFSNVARPPAGDPLANHPYVRLPAVRQDAILKDFSPERMRSVAGVRRNHVKLLANIRELLLRPEIDQEEVEVLVSTCEDLANHAFFKMSQSVASKPAFAAAERLGRRFMVINALYSVSAALGANWQTQEWWKELGRGVPTDCVDNSLAGQNAQSFYAKLVFDISEALRLYKSGSAPSNEMVFSIKKRLFCTSGSLYFMKDLCWAPWRKDGEYL